MTSNTYRSTYMQKLLGRHYKWLYIAKYHFDAMTFYRGNTIFWSFFGLFNFWLAILVWYINFQNGSNLDISTITTYLFFGNLFSQLINNWIDRDISSMVTYGSLAKRLISPTHLMTGLIVEFVGKSLATFLTTSIIFLLSAILVWPYLRIEFSINSIVLLIAILPISYLIIFYLNFMIGCTSFWFTNIDGLINFKGIIFDFLKGGYVPLFLLTGYFSGINYQPLAWLLHHPLQIYLGKYSLREIFGVFIGGVIWCMLLAILAKFVFQLGLKRNESVGM
jgi:ABC-2 type transport system permease protein